MKTAFRYLLVLLTLAGFILNGHAFAQTIPGSPQVMLDGKPAGAMFNINKKLLNGVTIYSINLKKPQYIKGDEPVGIYFNEPANFNGGVVLWGYKWGIWSKPVQVESASKMPGDRVQFFYWKEKDGTYGAAVPLSGNGYRTVLGSQGNLWGSRATSLLSHETSGEIPAVAIAYGKDPFELFRKIYTNALIAMGRSEDMRWKKKLPEPFQYLGWCTWNSSDLGRNLDEDEVISGVKTFTDHHFPLGWVLVDDGWFQEKNGRLQSMLPTPKKFPNGFAGMNKRLKTEFGIKYTGIWHAFDGYWSGIDPESKLGRKYKNDLYSWGDKKNPNYFFKLGSPSLTNFYDEWYRYFKQQGFDLTKVDNQVVGGDLAHDNYPVFTLSAKVHEALYKASNKYFNGAIINCMDMVPDAYFNFGNTAVARSEEDYFPDAKGYNLESGNASAHVMQAIYNSIYFSQMVYPDFDMFETNNPNAVIHAVARALSSGPVYITDHPGTQNFDILNALVYHDGRLVHTDHPLLPTADCLLQVQDKKLFKAFSMSGKAGLIDAFNGADTDKVSGTISPADVDGIGGEKFVVYEHFSGEHMVMNKYQQNPVELPRLGYKLYYVIPVKNGFAPIGLTEKYAAPASVLSEQTSAAGTTVTIYEGGLFKAYSAKKPKTILLNGHPVKNYEYANNIITMNVPQTGDIYPRLLFKW
jgi:raffinose synthase